MRQAIVLLTATLLAAPAAAVEEFPSGFVPSPADRRALEEYQKGSRAALDELTEIVARTAGAKPGQVDKWDVIAAAWIATLSRLAEEGHVPEKLDDWHAAEVKAWHNVRTIGGEMLRTHSLMALSVEAIEDDIVVSDASSEKFIDTFKKIGAQSGRVKKAAAAAADASDLVAFREHADEAGLAVKSLTHLGRTASTLWRKYKIRKEKFVDTTMLHGDYKSKLDALRDKNIDPDQSGRFVAAERKWEEELFKTWLRYTDAVADWDKANPWLTDDAFVKILKQAVPELLKVTIEMGLDKSTFGLTKLADLDKLEKTFWKLDAALRKMSKTGNEKWAEIEMKIVDARGEKLLVEKAHKDRMDEIRIEAGQRYENEAVVAEKTLEDLEKRETKLYAKLGKTTPNTAKSREIEGEIAEIEVEKAGIARDLEKLRKYYHFTWRTRQEADAEKARRKALDQIDARVREYEGEKAKL